MMAAPPFCSRPPEMRQISLLQRDLQRHAPLANASRENVLIEIAGMRRLSLREALVRFVCPQTRTLPIPALPLTTNRKQQNSQALCIAKLILLHCSQMLGIPCA